MKRSVKNMLTFLVVGTVLLATTAPVLAAQFTEKSHVAPYFPPEPENSEKEIMDVIRWDNIPGNDSELLLKFIRDEYDINWSENATISKSNDSMTIFISTDEHSAEIIMDESDEEATLKTDDGRTYKLMIVKEDGELCISPIIPCQDVLLLEDSDNFTFEDSLLNHSNAVPAEVIVGFKRGITAREQESIIELHNVKILERLPALNAVLLQVSDAQAFIARITEDIAVEYAEQNYMINHAEFGLKGDLPKRIPTAERVPPFYSFISLWHIPNDPLWDEQYNLRLIEADYNWKDEKGDKSIKVAVVDTGIQYDHQDLKGNYVSGGYDWVNDDSDPYDDEGHGTHCAGIVAAEMDNKKGIAGIAQVSIMAEKVLDGDGKGTPWDSARGIIHAADEGANILSLSLGTQLHFSIYENACQYAWNAGCLLIAASGNDGIQSIGYPARFDTVIAVGAIDKNLKKLTDSNYGSELELVAPGAAIISTCPTNDYTWHSGTSEAAPHVAGVVALLWSKQPSITNHQIRSKLQFKAIDLGPSGWDEYYGYGLVNVRVPNSPVVDPFDRLRRRIYMHDNYTTIQDAVTNADDLCSDLLGIVLIVRDGIYKENVKVATSGGDYRRTYGPLCIESENGPTNCIVQAEGTGSVFLLVGGITLPYKSLCISGLTVTRASPAGSGSDGIHLVSTGPQCISNNIITNHSNGILLYDSLFVSISNNTCTNNKIGIFLDHYSKHNRISLNTFSNNEVDGIRLWHSTHNYIYLNHFINNTDNVDCYRSTNNTWHTEEMISYNYNRRVYTSYLGNYWDDYKGTDGDGDGIGDTPYVIDSDNKDIYPLVVPFDNYQTSDI